uniref:MICOS complex subunit MIC13 n=1 Tax=Electrophorus electricus TaxID=8005 RepID=A0A4W4HFL4_ELEEL
MTKVLPVVKLATKVAVAGGAVYVAYDSGLLGGGEEGAVALSKATAAIPPAVNEWAKYFGFEFPAAPKVEFSPVDAWNSGKPLWSTECVMYLMLFNINYVINYARLTSKTFQTSFTQE